MDSRQLDMLKLVIILLILISAGISIYLYLFSRDAALLMQLESGSYVPSEDDDSGFIDTIREGFTN